MAIAVEITSTATIKQYEAQLAKDWEFIVRDCDAKALVVAIEVVKPFIAGAPPPTGESSAGKSAGPLGQADAPRRAKRPGLGTEFGEQMGSPVREVHFVRASAGRPAVVLGVRYDDRQGLMALGIDVDRGGWEGDTYLRQSARPFPVVSRGYSAPPPGWRRW